MSGAAQREIRKRRAVELVELHGLPADAPVFLQADGRYLVGVAPDEVLMRVVYMGTVAELVAVQRFMDRELAALRTLAYDPLEAPE